MPILERRLKPESALNAKVDASTRNILVRAQFDNLQGLLLPGTFAAVKLMLKQNDRVVTLTANGGDLFPLWRISIQGESTGADGKGCATN